MKLEILIEETLAADTPRATVAVNGQDVTGRVQLLDTVFTLDGAFVALNLKLDGGIP